MKPGVQQLDVSLIDDGESIQSRAEVNPDTVEEYSAAMKEGAEFPPIVVFYDGATYRISDGLHRYTAVVNHGGKVIAADLREGDRVAALLHAVGANAVHGLRRTNKDKAHAVTLLLAEAACSDWSDREIAKACGVSHTMVANTRRLKSGNGCHPQPLGSGNQRDSLPPTASGKNRPLLPRGWQQTASDATPDEPPTSRRPEVDPVHAEAARLEDRLVALTNDICAASARAQRLLGPTLETSLRRLERIGRGAAA